MDALMLHHVVSGRPDGQALVLLGSLGSTLAMWEPVLELLEPHLRVIRIDHLGHGGSPVPAAPYSLDDMGREVLRVMDHLSIPSAHVAGVSLGGLIGQWLALNAPHRLNSLVVMCSASHFPPESAWRDRAAVVRAEGMAAIADAVVERWLTTSFAQAHPDVRAQLVEMVSSTPVSGYAACCEVLAEADLSDDLGRIDIPLLAIAGADDPATPPERLASIVESVPNGRLVILESAAHVPTYEQPVALAAAILNHIGRGD
jgi:3-oxoadipate enol-lactonase